MATLHSNLYGAPEGSDTMIYRGASGPMTKGGVYAVIGTISIASTLDEDAKLLEVPEGTRLLRIAIVPSADLDAGNTFTFNLGWSSDSNEFASASAGLQGTAAFELDAAGTAGKVAAQGGDALVMTAAAGALSAGTLTFVAELAS